MDSLSFAEQLLPFFLPALVALVKRVFRRLPKWTVPMIVLPSLGMVGQWLAAAAQGAAADPVTGLLLAAAAVLVRESADQLKKAALAVAQGDPLPRVGDSKDDSKPTLSRGLQGIG